MVNDPGTPPSSTSGRLWTDPREEDEAQPWLAPRTPVVPQPPLREPEDPGDEDPRDGRRFYRGAALAAMAIFALIGAGFLANDIFGGDDASQPAALPVVPGASPADQRSRTVRAIYASAKKSVVSVRVGNGSSTASGTGFLIDSGTGGDATIVTNFHVVSSAKSAQVRLDDKDQPIDARVVGTDQSTDVAVLKVDADDVAGRPRLTLADSDKVQVGDLAIAIGYPFGQPQSVTTGIVSGLERTIRAPNNFSIDGAIQTDAAINPGNSGGPLLDSAGRVIGVNSQIATTTGGNVGIGFAVSSDTVRDVVPKLEGGGTIRRAFLGVGTKDQPASGGALVEQVVPSGPGDAAGLREGDVIRRVDGREVQKAQDVIDAVLASKVGETVEIEIERGGATRTLQAKLGTRSNQSSSGTGGPP